MGSSQGAGAPFPGSPLRHLDVQVWPAKIAVELRDLVLEDQVISKGLPGKLADEPVILMLVVAVVGSG